MSNGDNITQSGVFQVGVAKGPTTINSIQVFRDQIVEIVRAIDAADAQIEEKNEAKTRLKALLDHPLIAAVVGAALGGLVFR